MRLPSYTLESSDRVQPSWNAGWFFRLAAMRLARRRVHTDPPLHGLGGSVRSQSYRTRPHLIGASAMRTDESESTPRLRDDEGDNWLPPPVTLNRAEDLKDAAACVGHAGVPAHGCKGMVRRRPPRVKK